MTGKDSLGIYLEIVFARVVHVQNGKRDTKCATCSSKLNSLIEKIQAKTQAKNAGEKRRRNGSAKNAGEKGRRKTKANPAAKTCSENFKCGLFRRKRVVQNFTAGFLLSQGRRL